MSIQAQIDVVNERIKTTNGRMTEMELKVNQKLLEVLEMIQENQAEARRQRKELGNLSHRLGTIVEDFVAPNLSQILRDVANLPHEVEVVVNTRVRRRRPDDRGQTLELDATAVARNFVLLNETKTTLRPEHVELFVNERLPLIRTYFPEYQDKTIYAAVSSFRIDRSLQQYITQNGLLALGLVEDWGWMSVLNEDEVTLKMW